ncbi:MAG: MFS transporter [Anaerolineae bacterium]|nr:MFS transporter [Anaerolineae bacterium]MCI0610544.1 MFS transporter [Anaerolineae bacterium]
MNQKYILTIAYYLAFILLGLTLGAEGPTLPKLAENTSSTLDQISLIFFSGSLGYLLGSYVSGRIYDRLPGHQFLAGVLLLMGITIAFVPVATSLWMLLLITLIAGFAKGSLDVGGNTLIIWVHHEKVGPFMNGLHAFFGVGAFIGPLIVARVLMVTENIYWVYWTLAIAAFPIAALIWSLPSPSRRVTPEEHKDAPLPVLLLAIMVLCFVLYVGAEVGFGTWIYTYALQLGLGTEITSAYLASAFWGSFTLGRLLAIPISTRLRPIAILYLDFAGCLLSLGLILLFRDSAAVLWIGSILLGLSFASIFPTFLTLAEERMHVTGTMAGWFLVGGSIGGMILPWGIGQAFVRIGAGAMITIVFIAVAFNLLALITFTRTPVTAPRKSKEISVDSPVEPG